jgi:hypothetical protein
VRILGHPTGRLLLRREPFALDLAAVLRARPSWAWPWSTTPRPSGST